MALDAGLVAWIEEAMAPIGRVTWRRMMGGATLYCDGTIFAIVAHDALWFKADTTSDESWNAAGCARFTADMAGRIATMNYRRAPDEAYDDAEALRGWARLGLAAGLRNPPKPKRGGRTKPAPSPAAPASRSPARRS